jgi:maltose-binding protein MalE
MKNRHMVLAVALLCAAGCLASCGDNSSRASGDSVWVCVYDGGYGTKWLEDVAAAYTAKTGVKVEYAADATILDRLEGSLRDGGDYDIYMSHDINWQTYAANGWLANLDDLYASSVDGFTNTTFKDRLVSGAADLSKTTGQGDTEDHYYKVCYTQGAGGFIYNIDMFKTNNWSVPTTYAELQTLCAKILADAVPVSASSHDTIVPFAWSGKDRQYYWDYPVYEWWAQLAGMDKINTWKQFKGPDGKYADGYEMFNPDTYYKEFMQAYQMWWDLIANDSANSYAGSYSGTLSQTQSAFVNGKAAMIPYAQWGKYELTQITDNKKLDFNIGMMKTPKAAATASNVNFMVGFGDSMIIPSNSPNIEKAKDFLKYLATAEACKTFVQDSNGAFLAFDYKNVDLSDLESTDTFVKSVHEKLSDTNFTIASTNPITYRTVNKVMPWVNNKYYYADACSKPAENTASTVGAAVYSAAKQGWPTWLSNAGLKD